jgi:hypothetical protein
VQSDKLKRPLFSLSNCGETKTFELSAECSKQLKCLAFYSDCSRKADTIEFGIHLCLVFHLVAERSKQTTKPAHSNNLATISKLQLFAKKWICERPSTKILGYPLQFKVDKDKTYEYYRERHCLFKELTGDDETVFNTLKNAKSMDGTPLFDIELVLMEHWFDDDGDGDASAIQCYDKDGNMKGLGDHYLSHSDGWWREEVDFVREQPDVYIADNQGKFEGNGIDHPYYKMFYKWGKAPHVTRSDGFPELTELWYAAGIIIAPALN